MKQYLTVRTVQDAGTDPFTRHEVQTDSVSLSQWYGFTLFFVSGTFACMSVELILFMSIAMERASFLGGCAIEVSHSTWEKSFVGLMAANELIHAFFFSPLQEPEAEDHAEGRARREGGGRGRAGRLRQRGGLPAAAVRADAPRRRRPRRLRHLLPTRVPGKISR